MTYGHFTLSEFEQRKDNPFLEDRGRWYRITETYAIPALDRVNYQAEECDPREAQAWLAEKVVVPEPEQVPVVEPEQVEPEVDTDFDGFLDELEESLPLSDEPDEWTPVPIEETPSLPAWAKGHGWAGVGRISNKLREAYKAEFGE